MSFPLSRPAPALLLDVQTANGAFYFWSSIAGSFPQRITNDGVLLVYQPWLVSAGPFTFSRSLSRDGGQIVIQNVSGNTLERDTLKALRNDEFEGALAVFRIYDHLAGTRMEFHGLLSQQSVDESKATFKLGQLLDPTQVDIPQRVSSTRCTWIYKSDVCGSVGTAPSCPKTPEACKDPRRDAFHRFNGFGSPPLPQLSSIQFQQPQPSAVRISKKVYF